MTDDICTLIWKESKELLQQGSSRTGSLIRLIFPIVLIGILLPWKAGENYLTSRTTLMGMFWLVLIVAISVTVDSFAGERERHTLETLLATRLSDDAILFGKLIASVAYEWLSIIVTLALGLITLNLSHKGQGPLLLFTARHTVTLLVWPFLASILMSTIAILLSLRASTVRQASQTLVFGSMILFFAGMFGFEALPESWRSPILRMFRPENLAQTEIMAGLLAVVLIGALLFVARLRFRRAQLILD